ncbi:TIGR02808 family protein [Endozoicomonadaceae bacterium StTr2]
MSTLEYVIWHILGYSVMPMIFIAGFAITALVACFLIDISQKNK